MMYCADLIKYKRFHTREVKVGDLGIGGTNPIRIQSMTTTNTMDVSATVEQSMRMIEEGCELVRITAPSINEAHNLKHIRSELEKRSCFVPLIADIHFTPNAAEVAARIIQKVRVNPGNYADKKRFNIIEYSDKQYNDEIERIEKKFTPLVKICKEYGTAMRIGTNHGSLSDRIMSRYGDTPIGMVESAMEFVRICEASNYYDIILSMKASNPQVMVQAYRLLVQQMIQTKRKYPLHLGVTEAGDGEDGRVKSAVGIGALMEDGLGDTIRVSLTEEPEKEIPVAKKIIERYMNRNDHAKIEPIIKNAIDPYHYIKRRTEKALNIGSEQVPVVMINAISLNRQDPIGLKVLGYHYDNITDKWNLDEMACDYIYLGSKDINYGLPGSLRKVFDFSYWKETQTGCPLFNVNEYLNAELKHKELNFLDITIKDLGQELIDIIKQDKSIVLILGTNNKHGLAEQRRAVLKLYENDCKVPVVIRRKYNTKDIEMLQVSASADLGGLLLDGIGDGIFIDSDNENLKEVNSMSFGILQATRTRISKTEYIACPSCGRTLFDLQEVTAMIRSRTDHLIGVKIGIMGCIVNGPGEMADADYGYVGSGPGKITLYRGQEVVKRSVEQSVAVDQLIELIKEDDKWTEPVVMA